MLIAGSTVDLGDVLRSLASERPIFHSEADFQFALAWEIKQQNQAFEIRLESRPKEWAAMVDDTGKKRPRLDLEVRAEGHTTALELKYLKRKIPPIEFNGEYFEHLIGVRDQSRFDVVKDISRIEKYVGAIPASNGAVVVLSTDPAFWKVPDAKGTTSADVEFCIHDGRELSGQLRWGPTAGPGTRKGHEGPIVLRGRYTLRWQEFKNEPMEHRVLVVEVPG